MLLMTWREEGECGRWEGGRGTNARLEVDHDSAGDVVLVVGLVEEDVLSVGAVGGPFLEGSVLGDAVLLAELLPKLGPDCTREVSLRRLARGNQQLTLISRLTGRERYWGMPGQ